MERSLALLASVIALGACSGAKDQGLGGAGQGDDAGTTGDSGGARDSGGGGGGPGQDGGRSGSITTRITISNLTQDCMPSVAPDPISLSGTIEVQNNTFGSIGPISFPTGAFLDPGTLATIATFRVTSAAIPVLSAGAADSTDIQKAPNSSAPADRCNTLPCGKSVIVDITPAGNGIPGGVHIRTNPIQVGCAY